MPPPPLHLTLQSELAELGRLATEADNYCDAAAVPDPDRFALQVALEEVATNIINHGYGGEPGHTFQILLSTGEGTLTLEARDSASAYDPLARPEVDTSQPLEEREIGGLGVHLVKKLMQEAHYERRGDLNVLTLVRHLSSPTED